MLTNAKDATESLLVCRLVEETKKEGIVDVSQAYSKIINSIREAGDAAKMADKAAEHAIQVHMSSQTHRRTSLRLLLNHQCVCSRT